jgi:hypothetical protein
METEDNLLVAEDPVQLLGADRCTFEFFTGRLRLFWQSVFDRAPSRHLDDLRRHLAGMGGIYKSKFLKAKTVQTMEV